MNKTFFHFNLGHLLTMCSMAGGLLIVWKNLEVRAERADVEIDFIKEQQKAQDAIINDTVTKLQSISETQAKITERLEWLHKSSVRVAPAIP